MVVLFNQGLTVGKEWNSNAGFPDANLMLLTATLNSFLVLDGGAEGLWVVVSPVSSVESRWLGEIWQLPVERNSWRNRVSLALFTECP